MELQFHMESVECLKQIKGEQQTREQTQELRLGEGMPDVGRVLRAWGQTVARSKEWQSDGVQLNCGVMVWVLYAPDDGSQPQCVQSWIPMSFRWDIPETERDGTVNCHLLLRSVDARPLSGRKLMLRGVVCGSMQAYIPCKIDRYLPAAGEDIQLLEKVYPLCLAREAGEKAYVLDEEVVLGDTMPPVEKVLHYCLQNQVEEKKVLGDKLVFRGNTGLQLLYRTPEGTMVTYETQIPFSQYCQLEKEYEGDPQAQVMPLVTLAELEVEQERLRLKAGMTGQYLICETVPFTVVEDAYSPWRQVIPQKTEIEVPTVLERKYQRIRCEGKGNFGSSRVVDVTFSVGCPQLRKDPQSVEAQLQGQFQTLYYDMDGVLQSAATPWQDTVTVPMDENAWGEMLCNPAGMAQGAAGEDTTDLRAELGVDTVTTAQEQFTVVTGLSVGETVQPDPQRPSLILRRAGEKSLWELAKENGSTVKAIEEANALTAPPDPQKMILIPVL